MALCFEGLRTVHVLGGIYPPRTISRCTDLRPQGAHPGCSHHTAWGRRGHLALLATHAHTCRLTPAFYQLFGKWPMA